MDSKFTRCGVVSPILVICGNYREEGDCCSWKYSLHRQLDFPRSSCSLIFATPSVLFDHVNLPSVQLRSMSSRFLIIRRRHVSDVDPNCPSSCFSICKLKLLKSPKRAKGQTRRVPTVTVHPKNKAWLIRLAGRRWNWSPKNWRLG